MTTLLAVVLLAAGVFCLTAVAYVLLEMLVYELRARKADRRRRRRGGWIT